MKKGDKDFSAAVNQVKGVSPDAVFYSGYYAEAAPFVQQLRDGGFTGTFVSADGTKDPEFVKQAGEVVQGRASCPAPAARRPASSPTSTRRSSARTPGTYSLEGYDLGTIMLKGIDSGQDHPPRPAGLGPQLPGPGCGPQIPVDRDGEFTNDPDLDLRGQVADDARRVRDRRPRTRSRSHRLARREEHAQDDSPIASTSTLCLRPTSTSMSMALLDSFWQLTIDGLSWGAIYALVAVGYTLVFGVLRLINFAHSEIFMLGMFGAYFGARHAARLRAQRERLQQGCASSRSCTWASPCCSHAGLRKRRGGTGMRRLPAAAQAHARPVTFLITAIGMSFVIQEFVHFILPQIMTGSAATMLSSRSSWSNPRFSSPSSAPTSPM